MSRIWNGIILGSMMLQLCYTSPGLADQPKIFSKLSQTVEQSVLFQRVFDGKVLYADNEDKLLIPASTSKLMIAAAVLDKYGPHSSFSTKFYYSGERQGATIKGDLIAVGSGDPLLINEKLWQMAADFKHMGINQITGDLIIDNSLFPGPSRDSSRKAGLKQTRNAYDAPVTAFGVNFNTFPIALAPGENSGKAGRINIDPYPINGIETRNELTTTGSGRSSIQVSRQTASKSTVIQVRGSIAMNDNLRKYYRSVDFPERTAGETLRAFLANEGISVKGTVKEERRPASAKELYVIESYPISKMIHGLNKFSNNYIADVLTQKLGADFYRPTTQNGILPGTLASGQDVMTQFLMAKARLKPPLQLYNGSGLDTRNRLNANHLVELLQYMAKRLDLFPEFLTSLPAAGQDGTLSNRFKSGNLLKLHGIVRAKTGTLTSPVSVSSLAGYLHHPQHGLIAFAIIENGVPKKAQPSIVDLQYRQEEALLKLWNTW
ncbi:MAG: D-alanyl-D-alanine carboxypeptidase/D-alanyl-D-alanine endopeptidase [Oligoflexus sp.]